MEKSNTWSTVFFGTAESPWTFEWDIAALVLALVSVTIAMLLRLAYIRFIQRKERLIQERKRLDRISFHSARISVLDPNEAAFSDSLRGYLREMFSEFWIIRGIYSKTGAELSIEGKERFSRIFTLAEAGTFGPEDIPYEDRERIRKEVLSFLEEWEKHGLA